MLSLLQRLSVALSPAAVGTPVAPTLEASRALFDVLPTATLRLDRDGRITASNPKACRLWGADTLVREDARQLFDRLLQDRLGQEQRPESVNARGERLSAGVTLVDFRDGLLAMVRALDPPAENHTEQALDAMVTIDNQNRVTFFNAVAERLWGYGREEMLGQSVKMLVPEVIRAHHDGYVDANRAGGENKIVGFTLEVPIPRKDVELRSEMDTKLSRVDDASQQISALAASIEGIASQTNLLSLEVTTHGGGGASAKALTAGASISRLRYGRNPVRAFAHQTLERGTTRCSGRHCSFPPWRPPWSPPLPMPIPCAGPAPPTA